MFIGLWRVIHNDDKVSGDVGGLLLRDFFSVSAHITYTQIHWTHIPKFTHKFVAFIPAYRHLICLKTEKNSGKTENNMGVWRILLWHILMHQSSVKSEK